MTSDGKHLKQWQFKKGQPSPNSKGRPKLSPEIQNLKKFDKDSFGRLCWDALQNTDKEAKETIENPKGTQVQKYLASIILKGRMKGDFQALDWMLTRSGLKPIKSEIELSGSVEFDEATQEKRAELMMRILERSKLIDDPEVREQLKKRLLPTPT